MKPPERPGLAQARAEVVVLGPAPPLRGGIAAHTARLVEHLRASGADARAVSYARLYPRMLFPGRNQRESSRRPDWSEEILDVLDPRSWWRVRRALRSSSARVVLQWWHPVTAPALLAATSAVARERLVAVCHNALPHERVPGAAAAARAVLGRCGLVVCHSEAEAAVVRELLGRRDVAVSAAPLPCLLAPSAFDASCPDGLPAELKDQPADARYCIAAGHQRPYKGGAALLASWKLAKRPASARLVLVGESYLTGKQGREISNLAAGDNSIVIVDQYVEDRELVRFLGISEALVAAHSAASQSGLIPIARALDLPCIVSDAGGLAEQVSRHGRAADCAVVPAGDVRALATAIEQRFALAPRRRSAPTTQRVEERRRDFANDWQAVVEAMGIANRP